MENETININYKNKLNLPKHLYKHIINQIPEKIKEPNKIELSDKMILMNKMAYKMANYSFDLNKKGMIIPKMHLYSPELSIIEIKPKSSKKFNYLERPLEHKKIKINSEHIINTPIAKKKIGLAKNNIIPSEYKIFIPKPSMFFKTKNTINNEYILTNNSIFSLLKEEVKYNKNIYQNKLSLPNNIKLHLIQNPEKVKKQKIINVPDNAEQITAEQIKPNKAIKRKPKKEKIISDEIFKDLEDMKNIYKKQIKPINIQDNIYMADNVIEPLVNINYEKENAKNKGNKIIPRIISNLLEINPIKIDIKLNLEKINSNEKQKEIKDIKIKSNYYNKNLDYKFLIKEEKLSILENNYQLTDFNISNENMQNKRNILRSKKSIPKDLINTIENQEIKNNNISLEEEIITNKITHEKPKFILNPIVNSKLIQKPEKISKLLDIPNETEEISNQYLYMNNPIKREKEDKIYIIKDEAYNDMDKLKKNLPKKLLIKFNITDKINLSENIYLLNPEYDLKKNKRNINIISNQYTELKPIEKINLIKEIKNEKYELNKNLLEEFRKEGEIKYENKKVNPDSTQFKFFDSNNKQLSKFNLSSFSQNSTNSEIQKQFFSFMHKKFVAFKLFNLKNSHDPRKKWFKIWNKKAKE